MSMSHKNCDHPATSKARATCRKITVEETGRRRVTHVRTKAAQNAPFSSVVAAVRSRIASHGYASARVTVLDRGLAVMPIKIESIAEDGFLDGTTYAGKPFAAYLHTIDDLELM